MNFLYRFRSAAAALQTKRTLLAWSNADKSSSDMSEDDNDGDDDEERHETKAKAKAALSARFLIEVRVYWQAKKCSNNCN